MTVFLIALVVVGVALDIVGVVLASQPRFHRWKMHGDDRPLWSYVAEPFTNWARARIQGVRKALSWRRGRPETVELNVHDALQVQVAEEVKIEATLTAEAEVWPSLTADPERFAARVFESFRESEARARAYESTMEDTRRAHTELERELSSKITSEVGRVNTEIHEIAVGGLRQEVVGLCLIVVGSIIALVAGILLAV